MQTRAAAVDGNGSNTPPPRSVGLTSGPDGTAGERGGGARTSEPTGSRARRHIAGEGGSVTPREPENKKPPNHLGGLSLTQEVNACDRCRCGNAHALLRARDRVRPGQRAAELTEIAQVITGQPAYEGHTLAQQLYERRLAERERRRRVPDWFSAQDVVWEPWEREAALAA